MAGDSQPNPASLESYAPKKGHYHPSTMEWHPQLKGEDLTIGPLQSLQNAMASRIERRGTDYRAITIPPKWNGILS